jgi:MoaA/NifB/PqqE/SkfB family radical SAM enzyme
MIENVFKSLFLCRQQKYCLPQTLIFFVTSRCNARCDFCLYKESVHDPVTQKDELTVEEIEQIAANYGRLHYLALSGGEPFIRKDIEQVCQAFINNCRTSIIDIPSNFYYTENIIRSIEPLVKKNPQVLIDLQLSIDHIGEQHNESRKVKGLYEKALNTFQELSKIREKHHNLKIKINILYLRKNRDDLTFVVSELAKVFNYDRMQISFPNNLISNNDEDLKLVEREIIDFIECEKDILGKSHLKNRWDLYTLGMCSVKGVYHKLLLEAAQNKNNVGRYCEAGRNIVVINEKGDIFPCEPLWQKIGNLRDCGYNINVVLNSKEYLIFRKKYLGQGKCNCTWGCAIHSNISVKPKYLPQLGINALKLFFNR